LSFDKILGTDNHTWKGGTKLRRNKENDNDEYNPNSCADLEGTRKGKTGIGKEKQNGFEKKERIGTWDMGSK